MSAVLDGSAIVYCEGAFNTPNGKTAHGLVRFTMRYDVLSVVDSCYAGKDAGEVLDGKVKNIPVYASLDEAFANGQKRKQKPGYFVIGLAPDGGRLSPSARNDVVKAVQLGLNVDSGLHDFLSEDTEMVALAQKHEVTLRDIRKPPHRKDLHFFDGKIEQVNSLKVALLGTDSAVGKRTTAWILVKALQEAGLKTEMIGTGQTAWMQGSKYGIILDSLVNDFVSGEIEHAVWQAWRESNPDVIVIEGQGSLMNPAYPGGFEIMAAGRPDVIILQHAPARIDYDGFPGYRIHPLSKQIQAVELISGKPVIAITINHENLSIEAKADQIAEIQRTNGLPAYDVLSDGATSLTNMVASKIDK